MQPAFLFDGVGMRVKLANDRLFRLLRPNVRLRVAVATAFVDEHAPVIVV